MSITFVRCSDEKENTPVQMCETIGSHSKVIEKLGLVLVYSIGLVMVLLQLRSIC